MVDSEKSTSLRELMIEVPRTARCYVLRSTNSDGPAPREVWYVLHGYAQLAADFAREFEPHAVPGRAIVAPEGLSRFYKKGGFGEIGASWMTSAGRQGEIDDYVAYLDRLHLELWGEGGVKSANVLGFSQGAATAMRWATLGSVHFQRCILWAGGVPPDFDPAARAGMLANTTCHLAFGERDRYFDREKAEASSARLEGHTAAVTLHGFQGGHRMDRDLLGELIEGAGGVSIPS